MKHMIRIVLFLSAMTFLQAADIATVTESNLDSTIQQSDKPVVIKAYAEWCGNCQANKPVYQAIANELSGKYLFTQFNIDDEKKLAQQFDIHGVPTFILIKNKAVVDTLSGALPKDGLTERFNKSLG